jgi:hypothetical protein
MWYGIAWFVSHIGVHLSKMPDRSVVKATPHQTVCSLVGFFGVIKMCRGLGVDWQSILEKKRVVVWYGVAS